MTSDVTHEHGVIRVDGRVRVVPQLLKAARAAAEILRENADAAGILAASSGNHRREALLKVARKARAEADEIDRQCDILERRV